MRDKAGLCDHGRGTATDSFSFDEAQRGAPTFDYLVGLRSKREVVAALEVHPAASSDVGVVIAKKERTRRFLMERGCTRCRIDRWVWMPTAGVAIRTFTRARALLAQNGIEWPVSHLDLRVLADEP